jgi:hypothetical protein
LGPLPYDERDLEAVLSGNLDGIAIGLRSVAMTLAALHVGPTRAELSGEAAARAAFRAFAMVTESETVVQLVGVPPVGTPLARASAASVPAASVPAASVPGTGGPAVGAPPGRLVSAGPASRSPHRHRARTGLRLAAAGTVGWGTVTALSGAVAAAVVVGAVVTGVLPGSGAPGGRPSASATATASLRASANATQRVQGEASTEPSHQPSRASTASAAASAAWTHPATRQPSLSGAAARHATQCRDFYAFNLAHATKRGWAAELKRYWELTTLAGGPWKIKAYCQALGVVPAGHWVWPSPGSLPGQGGAGGSAGSHGGLAGSAGAGNSGGQGNSRAGVKANGTGNSGSTGNSGTTGKRASGPKTAQGSGSAGSGTAGSGSAGSQ